MTTATEILDRLTDAQRIASEALQALDRATATAAALALARSQTRATEAKLADDDEWIRLPRPTSRCPISGWSRSTLIRQTEKYKPDTTIPLIRTKSVGSTRYYSGADVRRLLTTS